jgi:hypothetical protein
MTNFAVLRDDNFVENVIVAESLDIAEALTGKQCIEYDDTVTINHLTKWNSDEKIWVLTQPVIVEETPINVE